MAKRSAWRIPEVDVAEVRRGTGLSVDEFATRYGVTAVSIRKWESGISGPYKTARIILALVATNPDALHDVLRVPSAQPEAMHYGAKTKFVR